MNISETKTVDMLTVDGVSVLTQKFIEIDGVNHQIGTNHRCAYQNSEQGRIKLINEQSSPVINAVLAMWGDVPTVVEKEDDYTSEL